MINNKDDFINFLRSFYGIEKEYNRYNKSFSIHGFLYTTNGKAMTKIKTSLTDGFYDNDTGDLTEDKQCSFTLRMAKEIIPEHKYLNLSISSNKSDFLSAISNGTKKELSSIKFEIINNNFNINGVKFDDAFYSRDIELNITSIYFDLLTLFDDKITLKIYDDYKFFFSTSLDKEIVSHNPIIIEDNNLNQLVILPLNNNKDGDYMWLKQQN